MSSNLSIKQQADIDHALAVARYEMERPIYKLGDCSQCDQPARALCDCGSGLCICDDCTEQGLNCYSCEGGL